MAKKAPGDILRQTLAATAGVATVNRAVLDAAAKDALEPEYYDWVIAVDVDGGSAATVKVLGPDGTARDFGRTLTNSDIVFIPRPDTSAGGGYSGIQVNFSGGTAPVLYWSAIHR